jgi:hypothetical protein
MSEIAEYVAFVLAASVLAVAARPSYRIGRRIGFRLRRVNWGDALAELASTERTWLVILGAVFIWVAFALLRSAAVFHQW